MKRMIGRNLAGLVFLLSLTVLFGTNARAQTNALEDTWWGTSDGFHLIDFSFKKGGKVVFTISDEKEQQVEGTYTLKGSHVEMNFPASTFEGEIYRDEDDSLYMKLVGTLKKDNSTLNLTVYEGDY